MDAIAAVAAAAVMANQNAITEYVQLIIFNVYSCSAIEFWWFSLLIALKEEEDD